MVVFLGLVSSLSMIFSTSIHFPTLFLTSVFFPAVPLSFFDTGSLTACFKLFMQPSKSFNMQSSCLHFPDVRIIAIPNILIFLLLSVIVFSLTLPNIEGKVQDLECEQEFKSLLEFKQIGRLWAQQLTSVTYSGNNYIHHTEISCGKLRNVLSY